ncbi:MAG: phage tail protein [Spirochaetales bacterium]|nr:phage tail protein [Spirochaetales bacterium]
MSAFLALGILVAQTINTFSSGESVSSSRINQNFQMVAPPGLVAAFMLTSCPSGWIAADGSNGTPDLRGRFMRGLDDMGTGAAGNDPDGVRAVGAAQADAFANHNHNTAYDYQRFVGGAGNGAAIIAIFGAVDGSATLTMNNTGGNETRPKNVALIFCMRKDT